MRHDPLADLASFATGFLTGVLVMYYLDAQSGSRRRALVRDKLVHAGHEVSDYTQGKARHAANKVKGVVAKVRPGGGQRDQEDGQQQEGTDAQRSEQRENLPL